MQTTTINVQNIPCYTGIGIHDEEKKMGQRLFIDAILEIDSTNLAKTDDVSDTVSYVNVYKIVQDVGSSKTHNLIEYFGEEVATEVLKLPLVNKVTIKVRKPHIPFKDFQGDISIELTRSK